jgi:signal transduction histidine kinase
LDIARFTATPPIPSLEEVDLRAVLAEAIECSADVLRNAGCALSQAVEGPMVGCWDRRWLVRIVGHLLSNAAKYGGGQPIDVRARGDERVVRLVVRDRGIGISAEEQARIFQRFERAVPVRHYGGFGLGLWLVRRLVETLGGAIRVESRVGEGATFTVELPRPAPEGVFVPAHDGGGTNVPSLA